MELTAADILGPEGRIAARLANYEHRPQQLEMAEAVARAIAAKRHLVAEAGTGVGKSFAYLVPAILAATEREAHVAASRRDSESSASARLPPRAPKIVISTHTISLQEQLIGKDLPLLNAVIPREFSAVLVKGRRNYLSLRRLDLALARSQSLFNDDEQLDQLREIRKWSKSTADGSLSDLAFQAARPGVGRSRQRQRQLPGPPLPDVQPSASTTRTAAARRTRRSWSSITRCCSATSRCAAPASASCPITTS